MMAVQVKAQTTDVMRIHREQRMREEEDKRTRWRRCGWTALAQLAQAVAYMSAAIGVVSLFCVVICFLAVALAGASFFTCVLRLPEDQCVSVEFRDLNGTLRMSNERMWATLQMAHMWSAAIHAVTRELLGNATVDRIQGPVCAAAEASGLEVWRMLAGTYKS